MTNWEYHQHAPRTTSRFQPGIMVNVEFGVTFSTTGRPHTASMNYASRNMQEKLPRQRRPEEDVYLQPGGYGYTQQENLLGPHPATLMPSNYHNHHTAEARQRQQHRSQRLGVRTREQHERGSSAPPSLTERLQPISPLSPIGVISPIQHTSSMPLERSERPLPPLPSHFRLGEAGLPWSTEPWYQPTEATTAYGAPTMVGLDLEPETRSQRRGEDPQRVRELETLHQAMMTVDSLSHDAWETWTWDSVGDIPRGPRSLGWAVSSADSRSALGPVSPLSPGPPPYVVSQYEQQFGRFGYGRPRSSG
jgi:hypothetical protein